MGADWEVARSVRVIGAKQLQRLARELMKQSDGAELKRELLRNIRKEALPLRAQIRANLFDRLPKRGGLNVDEEKASVGMRTRVTGKAAGVRLRVANPGHDMKRLNRGIIRHPTFGRRGIGDWHTQHVPAHLISDPVNARKHEIQRGVLQAMNVIAKKITDSPHRG